MTAVPLAAASPQMRPWWDALADLAFGRPANATPEERGRLLERGHVLFYFWGEMLAEAGFSPDDFLRPESEPGAGDAGVLWQLRPGSMVLGFTGRAIVSQGPLGWLRVHEVCADGTVRELRGRPRLDHLKSFRALSPRTAVERVDA
ncbi:MAG: hypothetical protein ACK4Z5_00015 [Brevundimonas sp.]